METRRHRGRIKRKPPTDADLLRLMDRYYGDRKAVAIALGYKSSSAVIALVNERPALAAYRRPGKDGVIRGETAAQVQCAENDLHQTP